MTIVSHYHRLIFLKTMKTGGTSVEATLMPLLDSGDWVASGSDADPMDHPFFRTPNRTTGWLPREKGAKKALSRVVPVGAWKLNEHSSAASVRSVLGESRWCSYFKVTVERNPWDRMLSLWRWRITRLGPRSFDEFLERIESGRDDEGLKARSSSWSNWPIYTIDDELVADEVIEYADLANGLRDVLERLELPVPSSIARAKTGHRSPEDRIESLSQSQIDRIRELHEKEIERFGYAPVDD